MCIVQLPNVTKTHTRDLIWSTPKTTNDHTDSSEKNLFSRCEAVALRSDLAIANFIAADR